MRAWLLRNQATQKPCYRNIIEFVVLTLYHTIRTFNDPENEALENIVGKGENAGKPAFSPFPPMFPTLS